MDTGATRRTRLAAVVLVTSLSIALAEVSIGSAPWGLLDPAMWVLLVPVYGTQVLLLASIVLRRNPRPTLTALWTAGVIMGLYEFYVTRVLWDAPWDSTTPLGPVDLPTLIVVAGFHHPFVSTILPLVLAEQVLVREPRLWGLLPRRLRSFGPRRVWGATVLVGVVAGGSHGPMGAVTVASLGLTALAIWAVVAWAARVPRVEHLGEALPQRGGYLALWLVTVGFLAFFVLLAQGGDDPVSGPRQAFALGLYAVLGLVLARNLRHSNDPGVATVPRSTRWWVTHVAVGVAVASVAALTTSTKIVALAVIWGAGGALALVMTGAALVGALRRTRVAPRAGDVATGTGPSG
ncbi:MAG: hypothetical protein KQH57_04880 [Actinomycetales bacterium]|nr:hypothetical protein [Actinomycetales bacterium]